VELSLLYKSFLRKSGHENPRVILESSLSPVLQRVLIIYEYERTKGRIERIFVIT